MLDFFPLSPYYSLEGPGKPLQELLSIKMSTILKKLKGKVQLTSLNHGSS